MTLVGFNAENTCLKNHSDRTTTLRGVDGGVELENIRSPDLTSPPHANFKDFIELPNHGTTSAGLEPARGRSPALISTIDFPEGGIEAWLVVLGSFCASAAVFGLINTAAVFESYFATHQLANYTPSQIGWVFSLYLFIVFFVGIQVGPMFDRYGPRLLVVTGSVLVSASLFLVSICNSYYQIILTYSVLGGLGGALLNIPAYGVIAHFFNTRRGLATGIATTSGGVGGILFPILLQHLFPHLGFAWSARVLGFILLGLAVPANLFIRTRLSPLARLDGAAKFTSMWPNFKVFRDPRFALASLGMIFMECGLFVPLTYIISYASAHGQDATTRYVLLSYLNAGSVFGRVLPGFLADKYGRFNVIIITISLCVVSVLGLWLPAGDSRSVLVAYVILFGFASGSNLGLIPVCLGQLCDPREYGTFLSTATMVASFGTLSSVPLGGALLQSGWKSLILFSGLAYVSALLCYTAARVLAVGWNPRVKF